MAKLLIERLFQKTTTIVMSIVISQLCVSVRLMSGVEGNS